MAARPTVTRNGVAGGIRLLELYQAEGCPHSEQVREKLTALGVSDVIHNPRRPGSDGEGRNELTKRAMIDIGGEDAIPFLVDTDRRTRATRATRASTI